MLVTERFPQYYRNKSYSGFIDIQKRKYNNATTDPSDPTQQDTSETEVKWWQKIFGGNDTTNTASSSGSDIDPNDAELQGGNFWDKLNAGLQGVDQGVDAFNKGKSIWEKLFNKNDSDRKVETMPLDDSKKINPIVWWSIGIISTVSIALLIYKLSSKKGK